MSFSRKKLGIVAAALFFLGSLLLGACGSSPSPPGTAPTSTQPSVATTGSTSSTLGATVFTTSTTLLFPGQPSFMQELSGEGYRVGIVFKDQEAGATFTKVWVLVDPDDATRATNDAIYDHAVVLAEEYGAADATEGRLRVELSDAPNGEFIKDHIIDSRDFDLHSPTSTEPSTVTTILFPAADTMLGWLRLDLEPRPGVRLAVGGLREIPSEELDPRKRLIEGEIIDVPLAATSQVSNPFCSTLIKAPLRPAQGPTRAFLGELQDVGCFGGAASWLVGIGHLNGEAGRQPSKTSAPQSTGVDVQQLAEERQLLLGRFLTVPAGSV